MAKLSFTGHETFHCRNYWLKKGLDHLWENKKFNDEAVIDLGVGKNMVSSIRFWLNAFNLVDKQERPNKVAEFLFSPTEGVDAFCEDQGTIWLLHYLLVSGKKSSIYHLVFNVFRKERIEFTDEHLRAFLERKCKETDTYVHPSSLQKDVRVFLNNYTLPEKKKGLEEDFSRLLYELELIKKLDKRGNWYKLENNSRPELPYQVVLFCIRENSQYGDAISLKQLMHDIDSVGSVFVLTENGLMEKIEEILRNHSKEVVFSDDGGVRVLQFRKQLDHWAILKDYYG